MKILIRPKVMFALIPFLLIVGAAMVPLSQTIFHVRAATRSVSVSNISNIALQNVQGKFFTYPANSGVFDATPADTPAFTQDFPVLNFNPSPFAQQCSNNTGVDGNTRPFTDVVENPKGTCSTIVAQGNNLQAGVGNLYSFESVFTTAITLPNAGQLAFNLSVDDGWILSIGKDQQGDTPTYVSGPKNNVPASGTGAFTGYPIIAANNIATYAIPMTVKVNIPAAGTYPIEVDYTQCCGGGISLAMNNLFTPKTTTFTSSNYAGYARLDSKTQSTTFTDVQGTWTVPSIVCKAHPLSPVVEVSTWVGFGGISAAGIASSSGIEKAGIIATCNASLQTKYSAFFQTGTGATQNIYDLVKPGDTIHAEIQYVGQNTFVSKLNNLTQKWAATARLNGSGQAIHSAECFISAPTQRPSGILALADFSSIHFSNCQANGELINNGPITGRFFLVDNSKAIKASPSIINPITNAFAIIP